MDAVEEKAWKDRAQEIKIRIESIHSKCGCFSLLLKIQKIVKYMKFSELNPKTVDNYIIFGYTDYIIAKVKEGLR